MVFLLLIFVPLWLVSVYLLRNWQYFWRYFLCNLLLLIGYAYALLDMLSFGHDEYGLGRLLAVLGAIAVHTLLGLVLALVLRYNRRSMAP